MNDPAFITVVIVVVVVLLLVLAGVPARKPADKQDRICRKCRLAHPYFAQFCRQCGEKL